MDYENNIGLDNWDDPTDYDREAEIADIKNQQAKDWRAEYGDE